MTIEADKLEHNPVFKNPEKKSLDSMFIGISKTGESSKVISCFEKKVSFNTLNNINNGFGDEATNSIFSIQESGGTALEQENITCLDVFPGSPCFFVVTNNAECQLFKGGKQFKFARTMSRRPGTRVASISSGGLVAIGSDEPDIILTCLFRPDYAKALSGHKNGVKALAFNSAGTSLISSSADGTVKVWVGGNTSEWRCIHTFNDLITTSVPEERESASPVAWSPNCDYMAIAGMGGAVHLIQNASWVIKHTFHHDTVSQVVSKVSFSPNGLYLLCLDYTGGVYVWRTNNFAEKEGLVLLKQLENRICDASWDPYENTISMIECTGEVVAWHEVVPSSLPHPVIAAPEVEEADPAAAMMEDEEDLFGDDNDLSLFDLAAVEGEAEMEMKGDAEAEPLAGDDAFIVDDDGGGYKEDLRGADEYNRYMERSKMESLRNLERDFPTADEEAMGPDYSVSGPFARKSEEEIQPSFQSGSSPQKNNRHYLCYNMVGTICSIASASEDQFVVDVSFHDASLRPFHFTHHAKFHVATLGASGALFASSATTILPSSVHFRPIEAWGSKNEWTLSLPEGENVISVAVSNFCCAVATDANYLRMYTPSGVQTGIQSIPGPIVTILGSEELVVVVYHESGVFHGNQSLAYFIIDAESGARLCKDKLPISPLSTLQWLGFSQSGVPLSFDSLGILRGLFMHSEYTWTPIFDSKAFKGEKEETYWPMGCSDTEFQAVICRGTPDPIHPKPLINDLPLLIPFCGLDSEQGKIEEKSVRLRLNLAHVRSSKMFKENVRDLSQREMDLDKICISLIMMACKTEQTQRALDLGSFLYSTRSIDGAIKLASYNHLTTLAERLTALKELKMKEGDDRGAASHSFYAPEPSYSRPLPSMPAAVPSYFAPPVVHHDVAMDYGNSTTIQDDYDFSPIGVEEEAVDIQSQIFDATQTESAQRPPLKSATETALPSLGTKPKKKANPFASKPKTPNFDSKIGLGGGETIFESLAQDAASASSAKDLKRKTVKAKETSSAPTKKKAKADHQSSASATSSAKAGPFNPTDPKQKGNSILSHFAAVPKKAESNPVVLETPSVPESPVPNRSIVPENETEEERQERLAVERMFEEDGMKEEDGENKSPSNAIPLRNDPKGKGLMYPEESLSFVAIPKTSAPIPSKISTAGMDADE